MKNRIVLTLGRMARDPWSWLGFVLTAAGAAGAAVLLTGCSGMRISLDTGELKPSFLSEAAQVVKTAASLTGLPWLDTIGTILVSLTGGGLLAKRAVSKYDAAPFTAADAAAIDKAKLP